MSVGSSSRPRVPCGRSREGMLLPRPRSAAAVPIPTYTYIHTSTLPASFIIKHRAHTHTSSQLNTHTDEHADEQQLTFLGAGL